MSGPGHSPPSICIHVHVYLYASNRTVHLWKAPVKRCRRRPRNASSRKSLSSVLVITNRPKTTKDGTAKTTNSDYMYTRSLLPGICVHKTIVACSNWQYIHVGRVQPSVPRPETRRPKAPICHTRTYTVPVHANNLFEFKFS